jgi:hypothetical protein
MIVFINALDECEESKVRCIILFFANLTGSAVSSSCLLNVCMSSCYYPYVSVSRCLKVFVKHYNSSDILKYVKLELCLQGAQGTEFQNKVVG